MFAKNLEFFSISYQQQCRLAQCEVAKENLQKHHVEIVTFHIVLDAAIDDKTVLETQSSMALCRQT